MGKILLFSVLAHLAGIVISTSSIPGPPVPKPRFDNVLDRRGEGQEGEVVYFRTDLKEGQNLDPKYKNLLLSHRQSPSVPARMDPTLVSLDERDRADKGVVESQGIQFTNSAGGSGAINNTVYGNSTKGSPLFFNIEVDQQNPFNAQRITVDTVQKGEGFFYVQGNELKLASVKPEWDTWIVCDGHEGYPLLWWSAAVVNEEKTQALVKIPEHCIAVRLFVDDAAASLSPADKCQQLLENQGYQVQSPAGGTGAMNQTQTSRRRLR